MHGRTSVMRRGRWWTLAAVALLALIASTACSPNWRVGRGMSAYEAGEYETALEHFDTAESYLENDKLDEKAETRYFVYAGLTHHALFKRDNKKKNRRKAIRLLGQGQRRYLRGEPDALEPPIVEKLREALTDLGLDVVLPSKEEVEKAYKAAESDEGEGGASEKDGDAGSSDASSSEPDAPKATAPKPGDDTGWSK